MHLQLYETCYYYIFINFKVILYIFWLTELKKKKKLFELQSPLIFCFLKIDKHMIYNFYVYKIYLKNRNTSSVYIKN